MVNLLPLEAKSALQTTYYLRLATATLVLLGIIAGMGAALLSPTYFLIHADADDAVRYVETLKAIADQRASGQAPEAVSALTEAVRLLESSAHGAQSAEVTSAVTAALPKTVSVDMLEYSFEAGTVKVSLTGVAGSRAALIDYVDALKATRGLSGVTIPVSALVAEVNNPFTITALYTPSPL